MGIAVGLTAKYWGVPPSTLLRISGAHALLLDMKLATVCAKREKEAMDDARAGKSGSGGNLVDNPEIQKRINLRMQASKQVKGKE